MDFGMILYVTHSFLVKRISEIIMILVKVDYRLSNAKITAKTQRAHSSRKERLQIRSVLCDEKIQKYCWWVLLEF